MTGLPLLEASPHAIVAVRPSTREMNGRARLSPTGMDKSSEGPTLRNDSLRQPARRQRAKP